MKLPELEELYRRYRMDLYRYLCFLTHDPVQAEDLLSETFLPGFDPTGAGWRCQPGK